MTAGAPGTDEARPVAGSEDQVRVPIAEERVRVEKRSVELGEVRVRKMVEEVDEVRREPVVREDVEIERIKVDRHVTAPEEPRDEGDWLIIPIMEEVLIVHKQLVVSEEIRIRKRAVTEEREIRATVRRERAELDDTEIQTRPLPRESPGDRATGDTWSQLRDEIRGTDG
jgi:uncharacterized protein (TIGR02271 family)